MAVQVDQPLGSQDLTKSVVLEMLLWKMCIDEFISDPSGRISGKTAGSGLW